MKCMKIIKDKIEALDDEIYNQVREIRNILCVIHGDTNINYELQTNKLKELTLNKKMENIKSINFRKKNERYSFYIDVEFVDFTYTYFIEEGFHREDNKKIPIYYFNNSYKGYGEELNCDKLDDLNSNLKIILENRFIDSIFEVMESRKEIYFSIEKFRYLDRRYEYRYELWDKEANNHSSTIIGEIEYNDDYISAIQSLKEINLSDLKIRDFARNLDWEEQSIKWKEYKL